jgi:ferritin-like metal-binding protein YciE
MTSRIGSLEDLFFHRLAEMHDAESKLAKALPLVGKAAKGADLKTVVVAHTAETKGHVECIDHVAESVGRELPKVKSAAMNGLIEQAVAAMLKHHGSPYLDDLLIAVAQRIEHFEIASYETLCSWARELGYKHEYALLTSNLDQEKLANIVLAGLAAHEAPLPEVIRRTEKRIANSA